MTIFPKANTLTIGSEAFGRLTSEQQQVLRGAATGTLSYVTGTNVTDADAAVAYCGQGGTVVNASDTDAAAMVAAAASVLAELERDPLTASLVERIRARAAEVGPGFTVAPCGPGVSPQVAAPAAGHAIRGCGSADLRR